MFFPLESRDTGLSATDNVYFNKIVLKLTVMCWAAKSEMKKCSLNCAMTLMG